MNTEAEPPSSSNPRQKQKRQQKTLGGKGERRNKKARGPTGEQHNETVEPKGNAAVRGGALGQALQQRPELGVGLLGAHPDGLEHPFLHRLLEYAQAAACAHAGAAAS